MAFVGEHITGSSGVVSISGTLNLTNHNDGPGELRFIEDTDDGSLYTGFKAGNVTENSVYTMPVAYPSSDKILQSTDAGVLTWEDASGVSGNTFDTSLKIGRDAHNLIDFSTDNVITFQVNNSNEVKLVENILSPNANDGCALGSTSLGWSDLFLADAGTITFGNDQDVVLTHVADTGLILKHTATGDDKPVSLTIQTGETTLVADEVLGKIDFQAPDESSGTDALLVAAGIEAVAEGAFSSSSNACKLSFKTASSEAAAEKMSLSSAGLLTVSGRIITDDTTDATSTTDGSLQTDGGLSVAKDVIAGNDVYLLTDSAVLGLGVGKDATFTHDGTTGLTIAANPITLDSAAAITLDSATGDIDFQDGGTSQLTLDMDGTSGAVIMQLKVDGDDFLFKQYDGTEVIRFTDGGHVEIGDNLSLDSDGSIIKFGANSEITLTHEHDVGLILEGNGVTACPILTLKNTNNDATGGTLKFLKDGGNVADNDVIGNIDFISEDDGDNAHTYASIVASVSDMTGGAEGGKLTFNVAEHDGTVTAGLILADGNADGEIDVTIGAGANSVVTIAGDLDVPNGGLNLGSDASGDMYYRDASGVLTRIAVGSDNHVLTLDGAVPTWEAASGGGDNEFALIERGFTYTHSSNTYFRTLPGSAGGIGQWTTAEVGQTTNATDTITIDFQIAGASGAAFIAPAACTITGIRGYVKCGSGADVITARLYKCTGTDDTTGTSDAMTATQINAGVAISGATNGKCFTWSESISSNNALSAGESLLLAFSADGTSTQKNYFTITILGAWS